MKQYCIKCGQPTEYLLNQPKFCNKCGAGFTVQVAQVKNIKIDKIEVELENEEKNIIKNIEFEEIYVPENSRETLGSILKKEPNNDQKNKPQKKKRGKKIPKEDSEKMLKEILDESKALKPKK